MGIIIDISSAIFKKELFQITFSTNTYLFCGTHVKKAILYSNKLILIALLITVRLNFINYNNLISFYDNLTCSDMKETQQQAKELE